ncbi:subtilisin-like protein, partial [Ramicandelaber brevisporus]
MHRPDLKPAPTFSEQFIDGGKNDQNKPGIEANLDVQTVIGLASGVPVTFASVGRNDTTAFNQVSQSNANNLCSLFMQLGARGISVIVASGDGGVAGSRPSNTCTKFVPTFPASCPYVTTVGATTGVHEIGADLSAGGFSAYFARPSYQNNAVSSYL